MVHHYDNGPDIQETNKRIDEIEIEKEKLQKEKETILKKEEIKNKKAYDLSMKLQKLKELRDKTEAQITDTILELNKHCTHEKLRIETRNYPGGYLDRAEHWTEYWCDICGIKVDEKVEYGGFG